VAKELKTEPSRKSWGNRWGGNRKKDLQKGGVTDGKKKPRSSGIEKKKKRKKKKKKGRGDGERNANTKGVMRRPRPKIGPHS